MLQKISKYSKTITEVQFILRSEIKKKSYIKNENKKTKTDANSRALTEKDISFIQHTVSDVKDNDLKNMFESILKMKLGSKQIKDN